MGITSISVRGARQHNLKNIHVEIPRNTLTVITGLSGSGKSSLAFDTIYAEGQRRYVETLSAYARQFLDQMERPDVDSIDGLSPSIAIEQKTTSRSPRSTVGTITEIYDYLRLLYSSIGVPHCPQCGRQISRQSADQIVQQVMELKPEDRVMVLAPIVRGRKGEFKKELDKLAQQGYTRARIDGELRNIADEDNQAGQAQEPHHRAGGRSPAGEAGNRAAPGGLGGTGDEICQRVGDRRGSGRRRAAVLVEAGLSGVRYQCSRSWSRARSRSTACTALVPSATAWAASTISIRPRLLPTGRSRCWTVRSVRDRPRKICIRILQLAEEAYGFGLTTPSSSCRARRRTSSSMGRRRERRSAADFSVSSPICGRRWRTAVGRVSRLATGSHVGDDLSGLPVASAFVRRAWR